MKESSLSIHPLDVAEVETPIGPFVIEACDKGIHSMKFKNSQASCEGVPCTIFHSYDLPVRIDMKNRENDHLTDAVNWLKSYFSGKDVMKPLLCLPSDKSFTETCWTGALEHVPFGHTMSYGELAVACGKSASHSRAVGTSMSKNPFLLLVPCHRIIRSGGEVGNYSSGGRNVKKWLIDFEESVIRCLNQ